MDTISLTPATETNADAIAKIFGLHFASFDLKELLSVMPVIPLVAISWCMLGLIV